MFERWLMLAAALSLTSAALAESPVQEERRVAGFSEVYLKAGGELNITQGDSERLLIEVPRSYLDRVTSEVHHGRLVLSYKSKPFESGTMLSFRDDVPVKFHLTVKQLDRIALTGSGDITAHALVTDTLAIDSSGAGNVQIDALIHQGVDRQAERVLRYQARRSGGEPVSRDCRFGQLHRPGLEERQCVGVHCGFGGRGRVGRGFARSVDCGQRRRSLPRSA